MQFSNQEGPETPLTFARPVHGGIKAADLRALGLAPEEALDFSASISPLGPPEGVWEAMRRVDLTAYPDPHCLELREAIAQHLSQRVSVDCVLVGNGSTELIHLIARSFLSARRLEDTKSAFLFTPTYGEYEGACRLAGATVRSLEAQCCPGFQWDLPEAVDCITQQRPNVVFLCNPNNPTGVFLNHNEVERLAQATTQVGGLLVIDEAYLNFVENPWDTLSLLGGGNVALLRSMTKDYALTGLRIGYSLASPEMTKRMAAFQPDWSVNALAQAAGLVALADQNYLLQAREAVSKAKDYLTARLTAFGFEVPPSAANFLLARVGDASHWREKLMRRGIFVRDCASFGMGEYIRVGARPLPDCQRLVAAMQQILTSG